MFILLWSVDVSHCNLEVIEAARPRHLYLLHELLHHFEVGKSENVTTHWGPNFNLQPAKIAAQATTIVANE